MKKTLLISLALVGLNTHAETAQNAIETPVAIEVDQPSLTAAKGTLEVKTDAKTVTVSQSPNSPLATTITKTEVKAGTEVKKAPEAIKPSPVKPEPEPQVATVKAAPAKEPVEQIYSAEDVMPELSQEDMNYIKAVNANAQINAIESKVINQEAITKEELKVLRQRNPNL
ncbi:hypothetical protein F892_00032 [Acinetobacter vivianii]|uniref:FimV domain-containing protein n=1 Tax=Acinetobacter vivianii TaxID=1776742 RepID=N9QD87_9GAMM|nr:hypothetical protein [Acinetobacter vivianii]ENX24882.1 hypothetical protein F892_00032 [Acinetobacter vivianii]GGI62094.1 hypothetical protein GCM10011446_35890 [Acinetobacter vivianii]